MNKRLEWLLLMLLALGGVFLWHQLAWPRYQSINLSVDQGKAIEIARSFLKLQRHVDPHEFKSAVAFDVDEGTDRYLQRTLGAAACRRLIQGLHYDLFFWIVRFFKENQKEEYKVLVSSGSGEVIAFGHTIEDTAPRPAVDKEKAREQAIDFLRHQFNFDPARYIVHGEDVKKFDNRIEYAFSWQDKGVSILWDKNKEKGYAKLLTTVTVTGHEILRFNKRKFDIPDGFNRYVDNLKATGQNLVLVFRIFYLALLTFAIMSVVNRKNQVVMRVVKRFYIGIGIAIFVLMALEVFNSYQDILFDYPTTQSLSNFIIRQFIQSIINPFFIALGFILPALAGESLRYEVCSQRKNHGILSALLSSFCSVHVARQIFIGYIAALVVLGAQSVIFNLGFKYCGVWDELSWLAQASTATLPAFTALVIGFQASFSEEAMFRLFAINLFRKYKLPMAFAVFCAALIWGFGHTGYEIFPMWFRGLEVTCIGIIMGIFYLRYGLVCVVVAHFLIDAFLCNIPYLMNAHASFNFYSALAVVLLPLGLAFMALIFNRHVKERPLSISFNAQQQFNYHLLLELCASKNPEELAVLKNDLIRNGWDYAIIDRVFEGNN
ncbi:MAG: CPBP family intramembrane metalloprotease [Candidatus Omnitrophica bacterium]|nr:CPBP family intramembrane metalloprotease [Candidatus Omnitrophota bacterium]